MKRVTVILLLFCYLIPSIGLSVTTHYCGGKLASISFLFSNNHKCKCGKKAMKKNCCQDKTTTFKIDDTQNSSKRISLALFKNYNFLSPAFAVYSINFSQADVERHIAFLRPPPLQKDRPIFLLNRVFLI